MDESIAQMTEVTGCTPEQASQFLQLADGNVDQAMTLFFDGGDLVGGTSHSHTQGTTSGPSGEGGSHNPINLDDDDDEPQISGVRSVVGHQTSDSTFDADAEMARQMQEEMYGGAGGGGGTNGEEPIRAPIARQAQTLAGPGADYDDGPRFGFGAGPDFDSPEVQRQMAAVQGRRAGMKIMRPACRRMTDLTQHALVSSTSSQHRQYGTTREAAKIEMHSLLLLAERLKHPRSRICSPDCSSPLGHSYSRVDGMKQERKVATS